eukprot:TRINITY_DN1487_c5_g1_i1.p1 TRINITY_DN1487_c5_g1~~TRINITY_DN1487_c5_g1_i1.p1  ORF type:complete len:558 (-),score=93.92 TRINITY_DN1487_c5_g1_i1:130-1746(-)
MYNSSINTSKFIWDGQIICNMDTSNRRCQLNVIDQFRANNLQAKNIDINLYSLQSDIILASDGMLDSSSIYNYGVLNIGDQKNVNITNLLFTSDLDPSQLVNYLVLNVYEVTMKATNFAYFRNYAKTFVLGSIFQLDSISLLACNTSEIYFEAKLSNFTIKSSNNNVVYTNFDGLFFIYIAVAESIPNFTSKTLLSFDSNASYAKVYGDLSRKVDYLISDMKSTGDYIVCFDPETLSAQLIATTSVIPPFCFTNNTTPNYPTSICFTIPPNMTPPLTPTPTPTPAPTPTPTPSLIPTTPTSFQSCAGIEYISSSSNCTTNTPEGVILSASGSITNFGYPSSSNSTDKIINSSITIVHSDLVLSPVPGVDTTTVVNGNFSLVNSIFSINSAISQSSSSSLIKIQGVLTIDSNSTLKINLSNYSSSNSNPVITVSGCLEVKGNIEINIPLSKTTMIDKKNVTIIQADCINQDSTSTITASLGTNNQCTSSPPTKTKYLGAYLVVIPNIECSTSLLSSSPDRMVAFVLLLIVFLLARIFSV